MKNLYFLILISGLSCHAQKSLVKDNISIKIYPYEDSTVMKASAMPEIKADSELMKYEKRFYYLLLNIPQIHLPEKWEERNKIFTLYPDTISLKQLYLKQYVRDKDLVNYFEQTIAPIRNSGLERNTSYSVDELMEVSSKFFYCDLVNPDTSIQAHVCVGLNGVKEAKWNKDYTLLEAFCYEAIFTQFDNEKSQIWDSFVSEKKQSSELHKQNITTLNRYLEDVKLDLFQRMENNTALKKELLEYYELNKTNLAFTVE